jgi:DNA-binding NarL/FixJ family response regulator
MPAEELPWRIVICAEGFERWAALDEASRAAGFAVDVVASARELASNVGTGGRSIAVLSDSVPGWLRLVGDLQRSVSNLRVLLVTDLQDRVALMTAINAGVDGVARPGDPPGAMLGSIMGLGEDGASLPRALTRDLVVEARARHGHIVRGANGPVQLTDREWEILQYMLQGRTTREMATELYVAVGTIRSHISMLLSKLGVGSRTEAVALWERH